MLRACAVFASPRAVAITRAPAAFAIWIAVTPIPLFAPCTSSVSPARRAPRSKTLLQTVNTVSGNAAD